MKNKTQQQKILIVVSGGVVQSIFSTEEKIKVDLLDFDNEEFDTDELAETEFQIRKQDLVEILY